MPPCTKLQLDRSLPDLCRSVQRAAAASPPSLALLHLPLISHPNTTLGAANASAPMQANPSHSLTASRTAILNWFCFVQCSLIAPPMPLCLTATLRTTALLTSRVGKIQALQQGLHSTKSGITQEHKVGVPLSAGL